MKNMFVVLAYALGAPAALLRPGGFRALLAENLLLKQQLLILRRGRKRGPNLRASDRLVLGFCSLLLTPRRLARNAILLQPSTLLRLHQRFKAAQYRWLFSSARRNKPGPKGPAAELVQAIVELKQRNPRFGSPRIAQQLAKTFGVAINKDVVRRVLAAHLGPRSHRGGPSWLTVLGHAKDSLWSLDLLRVESILLQTHWVMVVMDQFSRRMVGFGVVAGAVDGVALCRMFNCAIVGQGLPVRLSMDHDPLFQFHRWQANLRILEIDTIRTVPYVPRSHPFVERLIGTLRREYLDWILFWNRADLQRKLEEFRNYYNAYRVHQGLNGETPNVAAGGPSGTTTARLDNYAWQSHCHGLFELPIAA